MNKIINKIAVGVATFVVAASSFAMQTSAATYTLTPWTYDPTNACDESATVNSNGSLSLDKPCPTATEASAGAEIGGVEGLSTTDLTLSYQVDGYCGAGAPRFNVYLSNGQTIFLGCTYGDPDNNGSVSFTAGNTYGGVLFPEGETITGIDIVQDETGQTTLSNIMVGEQQVSVTQALKNQCKNGGYATMADGNGETFRNQGQCVSYFNHL